MTLSFPKPSKCIAHVINHEYLSRLRMVGSSQSKLFVIACSSLLEALAYVFTEKQPL